MIAFRAVTGLLALLLLLVGPAAAYAQPVQVHRVGLVSVLSANPEPPQVRALRQALRELGHIEGQNLVLETRFAEGRAERLPDLFAELIRLRADVLVTGSVAAALAAKKTTTTVPVVFAGVLDALSTGIVANLARPGGNITGATFGGGSAEMAGKWVELLKEAAPGIAHMAVLFNSADTQSADLLRAMQAAARALKVKLDQFDAGNDAALQDAFAAIRASRAQGLIVANAPFFAANRVKVVRLAGEQRLPAIYFFNLFPDSGGLMSYGGNVEDSYRRAAAHVDKILKGAKPGNLPVDQATRFELVINLKTAKALGLTIPPALLLRADRVIE
jgi:putative ABC transport system substrate-binding protein